MHSVPLCGWVQLLAVNRAIWDRRGLGHLLPTREDPTWTFSQFETALEAVAIPGEFWPLGMQVASEQGDYRVLQSFFGLTEQRSTTIEITPGPRSIHFKVWQL